MVFRFFFVCTALVQVALSQCLGPAMGRGPIGLTGPGFGMSGNGLGLAGNGHGMAGYGAACNIGSASTGGGFAVTSTSPIAPTGVSVVSENAIEGSLSVGGNLPLLGSVALEGAFPTEGAGAVSYGCGDGAVGIASEGPISTGITTPGPVASAPALASPGLGLAGSGLGLAGTGLGFGAGCNGRLNGLGINGLGANGLGRGIRGSCAI